jgi:Fe-S oxidoreductase
MDQNDLRAWESKCIQDEPPYCQAACPIHVDVRSFMAKMAAKDFSGAWTVLTKTMPVPHILSHVCDHPCERLCLRNEAGAPLAVHLLEKSCSRLNTRPVRIPPVRSKNKSVAILGATLDGLTAAWDLARKGYAVTILHFTPPPESRLVDRFDDQLHESSIEKDFELLKKLGATFVLEKPCDTDRLQNLQERYDGLYLSMAEPGAADLFPASTRNNTDAMTLAGPVDGVYIGGWEDPFSPIQSVADGRKAAVSLDRHISGASMTASREKEGPRSTRLQTSLAGIEDAPRTPCGSNDTYAAKDAATEASRCLQCECLECVKVCPYLERFKGYPKTYARQIYNNASIVKGLHLANPLINSCSLCGLCREVCPTDFSMADLCRSARQDMVASGKMPQSVHEFALEDMQFSTSRHFAMARHQPGHETSRYLFFPGCQISSSRPGHTRAVYEHLCGTLPGGTALMLGCCGAPGTWAGRDDLAAQCAESLRRTWKEMGSPTIILACSSCLAEFRETLPDLPVTSLWTILEETGLASDNPGFPAQAVSVVDPCTARHEPEVQAAVRTLLTRIGCSIQELELSGSLAECCGFGGLQSTANPDLADELVAIRQSRLELPAVAYCAMCRDRLGNDEVRVAHLLDFFLPLRAPDMLYRGKGPNLSERRDNRARLKQELERDLWHVSPPAEEAHESITLLMDEEVRALLDKRRVLDSDLRRVIHHAETTGRGFVNRDNGHILAGLRPVRVTYWVEYSREGDAYRVHGGYSHRMLVTGTDTLGDKA